MCPVESVLQTFHSRLTRISPQTGAKTLFCRSELVESVQRIRKHHSWIYDFLKEQPDTRLLRGRKPVALGRVGAYELVVKRMYHGGLLAGLTRDRFISPSRFHRIPRVTRHLHDNHVPTPPIAFVAWERRGLFYSAEIGIVYIPNATDCSDYLFPPGAAVPDDMETCIQKVAECVRSLHATRVFHPDLNLMNFLYEKPDIWLLDMDKARLTSGLTPAQKTKNLQRLIRSIRKQGKAYPLDYVEKITTILQEKYEGKNG